MSQTLTPPTLKIGDLARELGLNVQTIRYYESLGILEPAARTESGYRIYTEGDEQLLRFVLQAKRIGFTLDEIREIVRQRRESGPPCDYVRETLHRHLELLNTKITELQQLREELLAAEVAWQDAEHGPDGVVCGLIEGWTRPHLDERAGDENGAES